MPEQPPQPSFFQKCRVLWQLLRRRCPEIKKAFENDHLIQRKYILSRASEHFGIDKFEPAPLLNKSLLDVGCGTNRMAQELALRGADCLAVDKNPQAIQVARAAAEKYGAPVVFVHANAQDLLEDGKTFDVVLCLGVLEAIPDPTTLIKAARTMLKPEGILVFSMVPRSLKSWLWHRVFVPIFLGSSKAPKHWTHLSLSQFKSLLKDADLHIKKTTGFTFNPFSKTWHKCTNQGFRVMGMAVREGEDDNTLNEERL